MRPRGEIAELALQVAAELAAARAHEAAPGATMLCFERRLAVLAVGRQAARYTVKNLVRAGHLVPVGRIKLEGARRALIAYAPAPPESKVEPIAAALVAISRGWITPSD